MLIDQENVGELTEERSVCFVKKESDVISNKIVNKIHRILNHKRVEQMEYTYRIAENLNKKKKHIKEVEEKCEICKKNGRSKSKPYVANTRVTDLNSMVVIELKEGGKENILWMIWDFTRFIK